MDVENFRLVGDLVQGSISEGFGNITIGDSHLNATISGGKVLETFGDISVPFSEIKARETKYMRRIPEFDDEDRPLGLVGASLGLDERPHFSVTAADGRILDECADDACR